LTPTTNPVVRPFPIARVDGDPARPTMHTMKLPPALQLRDYFVIATDPHADWRCDQITVRAISRDEARRVAREQLATVKRDHWSIDLVVEAEKHERLDADGFVP
jgi:hypothetical protein